jgi:hypothetical protein
MSEDLIESMFSDVDQYYPGSKRKRKTLIIKELSVEPDMAWDKNPYKKILPNGREIEMFTIGALADALGRPVITIRDWIKKGYIPASPYRLPSKKDIRGEERQGRRLYSRAMVEALIELFHKTGVLHTNPIEWSNYRKLSNEISEVWAKIRAEETK